MIDKNLYSYDPGLPIRTRAIFFAPMSAKIFLSWSGETSKAVAEVLRTWIPNVIQFAQPFFTPDDIEKGSKWLFEIAGELRSSKMGIICLTKDNLQKPWILFESGALSTAFDNAHVCTVLFDVEPGDVQGPLSSFQHTRFIKEDVKRLLKTINSLDPTRSLVPSVFDDVFETWWPILESRIAKVLASKPAPSGESPRSEREVLDELLELARFTARRSTIGRSGPAEASISRVCRLFIDSWEAMEAQSPRHARIYMYGLYSAIQGLAKGSPKLLNAFVSEFESKTLLAPPTTPPPPSPEPEPESMDDGPRNYDEE